MGTCGWSTLVRVATCCCHGWVGASLGTTPSTATGNASGCGRRVRTGTLLVCNQIKQRTVRRALQLSRHSSESVERRARIRVPTQTQPCGRSARDLWDYGPPKRLVCITGGSRECFDACFFNYDCPKSLPSLLRLLRSSSSLFVANVPVVDSTVLCWIGVLLDQRWVLQAQAWELQRFISLATSYHDLCFT